MTQFDTWRYWRKSASLVFGVIAGVCRSVVWVDNFVYVEVGTPETKNLIWRYAQLKQHSLFLWRLAQLKQRSVCGGRHTWNQTRYVEVYTAETTCAILLLLLLRLAQPKQHSFCGEFVGQCTRNYITVYVEVGRAETTQIMWMSAQMKQHKLYGGTYSWNKMRSFYVRKSEKKKKKKKRKTKTKKTIHVVVSVPETTL